MRFIGQLPLSYDNELLSSQLESISQFYALPPERRSQQKVRFDWSPEVARRISSMLADLFHLKCAYCESRLGAMNLERYRPPDGAMNLNGRVDADHYWWLAYDIQNVLPACSGCVRSKANRFPVAGKRAGIGVVGDALDFEQPLLLNPYQDNPTKHLTYALDGMAIPLTDRGAATIKIMGLNRIALVQRRAECATRMRQMLQEHFGALEGLLAFELSPGAEFSAFKVCAAAALLQDSRRLEWARLIYGMGLEVPPLPAAHRRNEFTEDDRKRLFSIEELNSFKEVYFSERQGIESVELTNFRGIRYLRLDFGSIGSARAPWNVLVGENGTGKSTILQAIALTLMGEGRANSLGLRPRDCVGPYGPEARVRVTLSNYPEAVVLGCHMDDHRFTVVPQQPKTLILGYGSVRLLRKTGSRTRRDYQHIRIRNLFHPHALLNDIEQWLCDLGESEFDQAAWALKQVLPLEQDCQFVRVRSEVRLVTRQGDIALRMLSDGYRSMIALVGDIMASVLPVWHHPEKAEAIVLIDEIEVHLHPRWKLFIVERLRRAFPRISFVCTTHDPLCLQGLLPEEVLVLGRNSDGETIALRPSLPLSDLRADQLLTSPLFGLPTTRPDVEHIASTYADLLAKANPSEIDQMSMEELKERLSDMYRKGETDLQRAAEQLLSAALREARPKLIDQFIRSAKDLPIEISQAVTRDLFDIIVGRGAL
ncbi:recombination protein F [compost metagenome]